MKEGCYYIIKDEFFEKFEKNGSSFKMNKNQNRPTFCCIEDGIIEGLYWAIPTSNGEKVGENISKVERVEKYCNFEDIRRNYYHIGRTNKRAIFCISSAFPITDKYVLRDYKCNGQPLEMRKEAMKKSIKDKLLVILSQENQFPNKFDAHITDIKNILKQELIEENTIELEEERIEEIS